MTAPVMRCGFLVCGESAERGIVVALFSFVNYCLFAMVVGMERVGAMGGASKARVMVIFEG